MIALASGSPCSSTATVPDHCDVTEIAASSSGSAPRPRSRATHARMPSHQAVGVLLGTTVRRSGGGGPARTRRRGTLRGR